MHNEVIVVAGCTHREGFIDEYESQLAAADIPFHLEPIKLPGGANDFTITKRVQFLRRMAEKFSDYRFLVATDAWDVLFLGRKQELIDKAHRGAVLIAAERNCYPESILASHIIGNTPWRYANAGLIAAPPDALKAWCDAILTWNIDPDILDQAWFNRRLAKQSSMVALDTDTTLFYVVSSNQEDGSLRSKDGRLWNSRTNQFPVFFHFSGHCSTDYVRNIVTK